MKKLLTNYSYLTSAQIIVLIGLFFLSLFAVEAERKLTEIWEDCVFSFFSLYLVFFLSHLVRLFLLQIREETKKTLSLVNMLVVSIYNLYTIKSNVSTRKHARTDTTTFRCFLFFLSFFLRLFLSWVEKWYAIEIRSITYCKFFKGNIGYDVMFLVEVNESFKYIEEISYLHLSNKMNTEQKGISLVLMRGFTSGIVLSDTK